ncbi:hypothetical protein PaecuDRAFT_1543 [Paenibacillus curdlanolyticus YK9]|uniref:Uncharacterized protein n=1 Tax=Paenibacillus curdlanolyticus YK9 TaxID=717606 RepID=E0I7B9_9BACL|nr:hypothetical protein [Paenibacillus curdlanolyticus]EFM11935.1 hypothetical protein PaecuDRAFT_1543 [Paenibacillus curdlanolyticus YK9]
MDWKIDGMKKEEKIMDKTHAPPTPAVRDEVTTIDIRHILTQLGIDEAAWQAFKNQPPSSNSATDQT